MDVSRLRTGERIAGASGIALILIMFIFKWFGVEITGSVGGLNLTVGGSQNAWHAYGWLLVLILLVTGAAAILLAFVSASQQELNLPVALSAIVTGLGVISLIIIIISLINPPDLNVSGTGIDHTRKIGAWLGLIAAAALTYGGWRAMQEEGTSFGAQADRLRGTEGGPPPPPPPPPAE